ncbi:MAG: carbon starvation protein A [Acidobacteria bacterium]|nr:MAG: carbon starvation protein A [Acidobacteriota bacterium]REK02948.1 MAG: carbon starvation protein A [Acidobacteriota bacterium]REK13248.1 MAG: carbon starvation protein A [Acidobacteriota bacterium]REK41242.1 MAG: carbon starvation protein A [Acidobacteriota bacterium]
MLALIAVVFLAWLVFGYFSYGRWVAKQFDLDDSNETPASKINDGEDYVPTRPFYLFGQHFSAISAAGPIAGPILACQMFGWLPCLIWIALGVVLIGAVHDFASLASSVRHEAKSIAEIAREKLGTGAGRAMMAFIWIALVYVIVAFTDITAGTFVTGDDALKDATGFNPGGAVAFASIAYLGLSIVLGLVEKYLKPPLWLSTIVFVPAVFSLAWLGTVYSNVFVLGHLGWSVIILLYCIAASLVPVWFLLQPRGYLGGFVLYTALALGVIGIFFGGYEIAQPAFITFDAGGLTGTLFPFLFVTIACGACSGFHGLVCSGTTSKQIACESHTRPVGYGAMLAEGFVAFIALVTIMIVAQGATQGISPGVVYGNGIGSFLTVIIGEQYLPFAITFGAMAFSTFVFDTLDVCMRLGRYIVQELVGVPGRLGSVAGTLITVAVPFAIIFLAKAGSWREFWTLFGASNQLLAALTLLSITAWLYQARKRIAFTLIPMLFVLVITLWALGALVVGNFSASAGIDAKFINGVASLALIGLAVYLVITALVKVRTGGSKLGVQST